MSVAEERAVDDYGRRYDEIMTHINNVKAAAASLAEAYYRKRYNSIVSYVRELWGHAPSYLLEPGELDMARGAASTVLAALAAEHYYLYSVHRKMKNIIITIVGMGGSGKTTYAVMSCIGAYLLAGASWRNAVRLVSDSIFFDLDSFVKGIKNVIKGDLWIPCLIADDIGEWLPKYWRELGIKRITSFFELLDQAKDWVGVLIFTARSFEGSVAANIRDKSDIIVEADEELLDLHRIDVFKYFRKRDWSERDTREKLKRMLYLDPIPATLKMPNAIWSKMRETRRIHADRNIAVLERLLAEGASEDGGQ